MDAYKTTARIEADGELRLSDLPFQAGDEVEIILLRLEPTRREALYPIRGLPIRYDDPTEPALSSSRILV